MTVIDLLPQERLEHIRTRLVRDGRVTASDLAREFSTSEDTIRRDLRDLAAAGLCRRIYGGALRVSPAVAPLSHRIAERPDAKAQLAVAAASLVNEGQTIFIDTGSTNEAIAAALPDDRALTVLTNAPAVAVALARKARCAVTVLGGRIDPATGGCYGLQTLRDLEGLRPDICFIGTCAVSTEQGLAVFDREESLFKRRLTELGARVVTAATREKVATTAPFGFASLTAVDTIVLEAGSALPGHERFADLHILHAAALTDARP